MRVAKLALPLIGCRTWESRPCTSPGQHARADPVGRGEGVRTGELTPPTHTHTLFCYVVAWLRE